MTPRKKSPTPTARWQAAAASAVTPAEQMAAGFDRLRAGLADLRRPHRDVAVRAADHALADSVAGEAARLLNALADRIEDRKAAGSR